MIDQILCFTTMDSVDMFLESMHNVVKENPQLKLGSPEELIEKVRLRIIDDFSYIREDKKKLDFFYKMKDLPCKDVVMHWASNPEIALTNEGSHLLFAEAWIRISIAMLLAKKNQVDDLLQVSFICCKLLSDWSKVGYRLDWQPNNEKVNHLSKSSPVGIWTIEWAKDQSRSKINIKVKKKWWQFFKK
ncbi:MAG: hypothetical protein ACOYOT_07120 [Bacteroidales bacterium]